MSLKTYEGYAAAGKPDPVNFLQIGDTVDYALAYEIIGTTNLIDGGFPMIQSQYVYDILGETRVSITLRRCRPDHATRKSGLTPYVYAGLCETKPPEAYKSNPTCINAHPRSAKKVYVCSPYRGDRDGDGDGDGDIRFHESFAAAICSFLWSTRGVLPIATHLFFPRFLDDKIQFQRDWALEAGRMAIEQCDYVYCAALAAPPSSGMRQELEHAASRGIPIEHCYYSLDAAKEMVEGYPPKSEK